MDKQVNQIYISSTHITLKQGYEYDEIVKLIVNTLPQKIPFTEAPLHGVDVSLKAK